MNNIISFIKVVSLLLLSVFMCYTPLSCKNTTKDKKNINNNLDFWEQRFSIIRESDSAFYFNRKLENLKYLIDDTIFRKSIPFVLYYFSGFDCAECISKGFNLIREFQNKPLPVYVISSELSTSDIRIQYGFNGYIFDDKNFLLNKQLNRTCTPIFIKLDTACFILNLYHPDNNYDTEHKYLNKFLKL